MKKEKDNKPALVEDARMALTKKNYVMMLIGFAVMIAFDMLIG